MPWHVLYHEGDQHAVRPCESREKAIAVACALLDRGIAVIRIASQKETIEGDALRALCGRRSPPSDSPA